MKAQFSVQHGVFVALFFLHVVISKAQTGIEVGNTVEFGGVTVSLSEQGRQKLQLEVAQLYKDRSALNTQLELLRQLDPFIQSALQKTSLPIDFRFLALPLEPKNGYWNMAPVVQKQLGLANNALVDEQYHPILATEAAVSYLAGLDKRNANALRTAVQYSQLSQAEDGSQVERLTGGGPYAILDPDSPAMIWKLLARRLVFNHEEPTFRPNRTFLLWTHDQSGGRTLTDIAFDYNLPTDRLQPFDTWLRGRVIPAEGSYPVLIRMLPEEYAAARGRLENGKQNPPGPDLGFPLLRKLPPVNSKLNTPITLYEINNLPGIQAQPGDNIITLAFYGGISVKQFMRYNDMTDRNVVRPGEVYYLAAKHKRAKVPFHVLARGQSMRDVSNIYGVQLKHLLRYNDLDVNQRVAEGRVIWLQRPRPSNQPIEYRELPPVVIPPVPLSLGDSTQITPVDTIDSTQVSKENLSSSDTLIVDSTAVIEKPVAATTNTTSVTTATVSQVKRHVVRLGQTYYAISRLYGLTVNQLYRWNRLSGRIPLRVGQELVVSNPGVSSLAPPTRPAPPSQRFKMKFEIDRMPIDRSASRGGTVARYHIVRPGQTVYRVALINKVSIEQVMRLNNLRDYTIEVGQRLRVK